jgi:hypothetical protein
MGIGAKDLRGGAGMGLVEVEISDDGMVLLSLHPPKREPVVLPMDPQAAVDLARGLVDGADQLTGHRVERGACPWCAQSLAVEVPDGS